MRTRYALVAAGVLGVALLGGCSSDSAEQAADVPVDLTGTWAGESSYAAPDGTVQGGTETLTVQRQDGNLFWGAISYTDIDGSKVEAPITGTLTSDDGIVATEAATLWQGEVEGDSMTVVVTWNKSKDNHGAFEMVLTKQ